jgi:hypothetical protein
MGTGGSFPGVKGRPGRDADHSPPSRAKVKKHSGYNISSPAERLSQRVASTCRRLTSLGESKGSYGKTALKTGIVLRVEQSEVNVKM